MQKQEVSRKATKARRAARNNFFLVSFETLRLCEKRSCLPNFFTAQPLAATKQRLQHGVHEVPLKCTEFSLSEYRVWRVLSSERYPKILLCGLGGDSVNSVLSS